MSRNHKLIRIWPTYYELHPHHHRESFVNRLMSLALKLDSCRDFDWACKKSQQASPPPTESSTSIHSFLSTGTCSWKTRSVFPLILFTCSRFIDFLHAYQQRWEHSESPLKHQQKPTCYCSWSPREFGLAYSSLREKSRLTRCRYSACRSSQRLILLLLVLSSRACPSFALWQRSSSEPFYLCASEWPCRWSSFGRTKTYSQSIWFQLPTAKTSTSMRWQSEFSMKRGSVRANWKIYQSTLYHSASVSDWLIADKLLSRCFSLYEWGFYSSYLRWLSIRFLRHYIGRLTAFAL